MALFVKLTASSGHDVWINADAVQRVMGSGVETEILLRSGDSQRVQEAPERVLGLLGVVA